jgi:hypothetical protein
MMTNLRWTIVSSSRHQRASYTESGGVDLLRGRGVSSVAEAVLMQRTLTFLIVGLVSAFVLTGCPEKKAEKEPPATAEDTSEEKAAADEAEEGEAAAADQKKPEEKKPAKADEKVDEGGW